MVLAMAPVLVTVPERMLGMVRVGDGGSKVRSREMSSPGVSDAVVGTRAVRRLMYHGGR
jgi:hypothetical protein